MVGGSTPSGRAISVAKSPLSTCFKTIPANLYLGVGYKHLQKQSPKAPSRHERHTKPVQRTIFRIKVHIYRLIVRCSLRVSESESIELRYCTQLYARAHSTPIKNTGIWSNRSNPNSPLPVLDLRWSVALLHSEQHDLG